jgi:hypothetical protein
MTLKFGVKFFSTFIVRTNSVYATTHAHKASRLSLCPPAGLLLAALPHIFGKQRGELVAIMEGAKKEPTRVAPLVEPQHARPVERAFEEEAVAAKEDEGA